MPLPYAWLLLASPAQYSIVPLNNCTRPGNFFCYQGSEKSIGRIQMLDPIACAPPTHGQRLAENCSSSNFTSFKGFDPIFRSVGLWGRAGDETNDAMPPALDEVMPPVYARALQRMVHDRPAAAEWSDSSSPGLDDEAPMQRVVFKQSTVLAHGARCLDGSPSGYYYRAGRGNGSDSWVFYLEGGGLCVEPVDCLARAKTDLGSSKHWEATRTDSRNVLSTAAFNPFADWNHVFIPYCSGDMHVGRARHKNLLGLYFAGHRTVATVVSRLLNTTTLGASKRVLLSGGSAGGFGTFHNADWLADALGVSRRGTQYAAAPQAGAFFVNRDVALMAEYTTLNITTSIVPLASKYIYDFHGGLARQPDERPLLDESCVAAHTVHPTLCWSALGSYEHISSRLFVAQNLVDQSQAGDVLGADWWPLPLGREKHAAAEAAFKSYFADATRAGIVEKVRQSAASKAVGADGLFAPSCYAHTGNLCMKADAVTKVRNVSFAAALHAWMTAEGRVPHQLVDRCPQGQTDPCNPVCSC